MSTRPRNRYQQMVLPWAFILVMASPMGVNATPGPTNPNIHSDYNKLPALEKAKITWDGIPSYEFIENFFDPLRMALGAISENGNTLLKTALGVDQGGTALGANPHYNLASAQIREQSANRNHRLFACILNYIKAASHVYRYLQANFRNDGKAAYAYILAAGRLQYTADQTRDFENTWDDLSIRSLRLRIDYFTLFVLAEAILDLSRKLRKNRAQEKTKFLNALPDPECRHIKSGESKNRNHVGYAFPAVYPMNYPAHMAGQPHPYAGQCDIYALARFLATDWVDMVKRQTIKSVPKGLVSMVDLAEMFETTTWEIVSAMRAQNITPKTKCLKCGGLGHAVKTELGNGRTITCPTLLLENYSGNSDDKGSSSKYDAKRIAALDNKYRKYKSKYYKAAQTARNTRDNKRGFTQRVRQLSTQSDDGSSVDSANDDKQEPTPSIEGTTSAESDDDASNSSSDDTPDVSAVSERRR